MQFIVANGVWTEPKSSNPKSTSFLVELIWTTLYLYLSSDRCGSKLRLGLIQLNTNLWFNSIVHFILSDRCCNHVVCTLHALYVVLCWLATQVELCLPLALPGVLCVLSWSMIVTLIVHSPDFEIDLTYTVCIHLILRSFLTLGMTWKRKGLTFCREDHEVNRPPPQTLTVKWIINQGILYLKYSTIS